MSNPTLYDLSTAELVRKGLSYASIPGLITLALVGGHVLFPTHFGAAAVDIPKEFLSSKLMNFVGLLALLAIGLSMGAPVDSSWYRLCKGLNIRVMELLFPLMASMFGVAVALWLSISFSQYGVGIIATGAIGILLMLTVLLGLGKLVFGKSATWHAEMHRMPNSVLKIGALVLATFLLASLYNMVKP